MITIFLTTDRDALVVSYIILTISAMYGETILPTRAKTEHEPNPAFRTTVGNISEDHRYIIPKVHEIPILPVIAKALVT